MNSVADDSHSYTICLFRVDLPVRDPDVGEGGREMGGRERGQGRM